MLSRVIALLIGVISIALAIQSALDDARRAQLGCDTTYIYEGYADVALPAHLTTAFPTYGLRRWVDRSPALQEDIAALRRGSDGAPAPAALLFVHGHLGSPHQMRSMASETVREAVRRAKAGTSRLWVEWHAADFGAEPSGFEPRLLERQAAFVAGSVLHLAAGNSGGPLVLVGYSMGGLVVESALAQLAGTQHSADGLDLRRVALVLTLGTPRHHLPTFLPPPRSLERDTGGGDGDENVPQPPAVHILAGPGDLMIPGLSAWATLRHRRSNDTVPAAPAALVQVDMDDVPGVWCTASHKAVVSCNQLVRRTVPLILDAAGGMEPRKVAAAAATRLTTAALAGLPRTAVEARRWGAVEGADAQKEGCETGGQGVLAWQATTRASGLHCWRWTSEACGAAPNCSLFLLMTGIKRGGSLRVVADGAAAVGTGSADLTSLARPLPGMLPGFPSATPEVSKRPWHQVLAGVDWMANATDILRIPLGTGPDVYNSVQVEVGGAAVAHGAPPPTLLAQIVPDQGSSLEFDVITLPAIFSDASLPRLAPGHPAVMELRAATGWHPGSAAADLATLLVGPALPLRISVASSSACGSLETPGHAPIFLAAEPLSAEGSTVTGDAVRRAAEGLPLWHPAVLGRQILLVSDPRCDYTLTLAWDLVPWTSYTLRYHAYALLPLAFALTLLQLGRAHRDVVLGLSAALLVGLPTLSACPHLAEALTRGHPWLPLSTAEVGIVGCSAVALVAVLRPAAAPLRFVIGAAAARFPSSLRMGKNAALVGGSAAVLGSSAVHPALPALLGTAALGASVATTPTHENSWASAWLQMHFLGSAVPAAVWTLGWAVSGSSSRYLAWSLERVASVIVGGHAWSIAVCLATGQPNMGHRKGLQALCVGLAGWTAAAGLWGRLHYVMLAAAMLGVWDLLLNTLNRNK